MTGEPGGVKWEKNFNGFKKIEAETITPQKRKENVKVRPKMEVSGHKPGAKEEIFIIKK